MKLVIVLCATDFLVGMHVQCVHILTVSIFIYHLQSVTFQLVVATDGIYSVIMFLYDQEIKIRSETVIGFAAGNMSTFYQMPVNQTQNVQSESNAGQGGLWMFRTDGGE